MKCERKFFEWTEVLLPRIDKKKQEAQPTGKGWGYNHILDKGMDYNIRQTWI